MKATPWSVIFASLALATFAALPSASPCSRAFNTTIEITYPNDGGTVQPDFRAFVFIRQTTIPPSPDSVRLELVQPDRSRLSGTLMSYRRDGRYETPSDILDHFSVWASFSPIHPVPAGAPYSILGRSFTVQGDAAVATPALPPPERPTITLTERAAECSAGCCTGCSVTPIDECSRHFLVVASPSTDGGTGDGGSPGGLLLLHARGSADSESTIVAASDKSDVAFRARLPGRWCFSVSRLASAGPPSSTSAETCVTFPAFSAAACECGGLSVDAGTSEPQPSDAGTQHDAGLVAPPSSDAGVQRDAGLLLPPNSDAGAPLVDGGTGVGVRGRAAGGCTSAPRSPVSFWPLAFLLAVGARRRRVVT